MSILVLSPHPDDESIGCGGSLLAHHARGVPTKVIFLSSGEKGGHDGPPEEEVVRVRETEAWNASVILGVSDIEFWRQPDGNLRATAPLTRRLVETLYLYGPELIYCPHPREEHPDHRASYRLLTRALKESNHPCRVLLYEVWTPLQELAHLEDITAYVDQKLAAIRAYESQCRALRFDDAMQGLARYRGEMHSWPGGDYAEAFGELKL